MIQVVSFTICPFVQRVTGMLEAKGVPYEVEFIDLKNKPQWFLDISPAGQVPLLVTESGKALFESDAIVEYLDDVYAPLQKVTPEVRAEQRAWSYQASKHYLVQCSAMQSQDGAILAERSTKLTKAFERAEKAIGSGPFFGGSNTLGNVDIAWLPLLHRADLVEKHSGYDFLAKFPGMKRWQQAILATGVAEKSVSDDFVRRFSDFYLSERTVLGRKGVSAEGASGAPAAGDRGGGGCC